jgi:hypothetical protein
MLDWLLCLLPMRISRPLSACCTWPPASQQHQQDAGMMLWVGAGSAS